MGDSITVRNRMRLHVLAAALFLACGGGDSTAPSGLATLELRIITTGVDIDADGFALTVDNEAPPNIPANGISLAARFGRGRAELGTRSTSDSSPGWSPGGTRIAFRSDFPGPTGADHSRLFIVNRAGTGVRQLTPETAGYTTDDGPSWSPNGAQIAFSQLNTLYLINPDGTGLTSTGVAGHHPAWSPDGSQIAYEFN